MIKYFIFLISLGLFSVASSAESPRVRIDEQRYADLLEDPYARRILGVIFQVGRGDGNYRFTPEEQADNEWFTAQGAKAFPVLLEVFKREPSPLDTPAPPYAWLGVQMQRDILGLVKRPPEGDLQPFVEETRRQITRWIGFPSSGKHTLVQFLSEGFELLAMKGDASDVALMEKFTDDGNPGTREIALGNIRLLKARLEAEKAFKKNTSAPESSKPTSAAGDASIAAPDGKPAPATSAAYEGLPLWAALVCATLLLGGIFWYWKSKGKSS